MGNYISTSDIKRVLSDRTLKQLADDDSRQITKSDSDFDEFVESIIDEAEGKIDSFLRTNYSVPLSSVPNIIKRYTLNITRYYLYDRRNVTIPQNVVDGFTEAVEDLKLLQEGKIKLSVSETDSGSENGTYFKTNKDKDDIHFGNQDDIDNGYEQKYNLDDYA